MKRIYLSLGSNVGPREQILRAAIQALEAPDLHVLRVSPVYETEPVEAPAQRWFLNLVVEAETSLFPRQLLARTTRLERDLGRKRAVPKGPRTLDIDILFYAGACVETPELTIPHPRFAARRFVLAPLADLVPDFRDPVSRRTIGELLEETSGQSVRPWGSLY